MKFLRYKENPILNYLHLKRHKNALGLIRSDIKNGKYTVLDLGCGDGYILRYLSSEGFSALGIDISKNMLHNTKKLCENNCQLLCANMFELPIKNNSIDVIVMMSVIEHTLNLEYTIKNIKDILKEDGILVIGYPIETRLFRFLVKYFWSSVYWTIDPTIIGIDKYNKSPSTHKQNYKNIRKVINTHFEIIKRNKLFFDILPDFLSYYEIVKYKK